MKSAWEFTGKSSRAFLSMYPTASCHVKLGLAATSDLLTIHFTELILLMHSLKSHSGLKKVKFAA